MFDTIDLGRGPHQRSRKRCINVMKDLAVFDAMGCIYHPKLACGCPCDTFARSM
jgi:hypothetical protein